MNFIFNEYTLYEKDRNLTRIFAASVIGFMLSWCVWAAKPELGDIHDGNRSVPVHVIELYDTEGAVLNPGEENLMPFSTERTCLECHTVDVIRHGWHFNAHLPDDPCRPVDDGRRGQPWILLDQQTGTQLPLSYRQWPGAWRPDDIGMSRFAFVKEFGTHHPGGFKPEEKVSDHEFDRWYVSGDLEINCLICHDAEFAFDHAAFAEQIKKENFRWAPTGSCSFAEVTGSAKKMDNLWDYILPMVEDPKLAAQQPTVWYDKSRFLKENKVALDLVRDIEARRCYYCHSTAERNLTGYDHWKSDEDVHMTAGMTCVDCHRNGQDHMMVRGYEGEPLAGEDIRVDTLSCKGCHLDVYDSGLPVAGRLGAPYPEHKGIPPIHFDVMTCTACHAGPWPEAQTQYVKTSRAHKLGIHGAIKDPCALPHIQSPVFVADDATGKLSPQKLLWPSFWALVDGDDVRPLLPEVVKAAARSDLPRLARHIDAYRGGKWIPFTDGMVVTVLEKLANAEGMVGTPAYITGGMLYELDEKGSLGSREHAAAQPYSWSYGHDVRPASQSLGMKCDECHKSDNTSPFFFGKVAVDTPLVSRQGAMVTILDMQESIDKGHLMNFNRTFVFRPMLKVLTFVVCGVLAIFLLAFLFKGVNRISLQIADKFNISR